MTEGTQTPPFPTQLLTWAGNRSGGVRRLFDESSGRPAGRHPFRTHLLAKLQQWCDEIGAGVEAAPRVILLVGGPGNGKTEAIEATMGWLDDALGCEGALVAELARSFRPSEGKVARLVSVDAGRLARPGYRGLGLSIVQDASVVAGSNRRSAAELLLDELDDASSAGTTELYLCCVNRGVLDDALIAATEAGRSSSRLLLEKITRAVSLFPNAPSCWPLRDYPQVAVWPMDMESLLVATAGREVPPAGQVLRHAIDADLWPAAGKCEAGERCPFCTSREQLSHPREERSLLSMLRWYELGSGKRWSFRDIFSLFSYLLAGHRHESRSSNPVPCVWAASMAAADDQAVRNARPSAKTSQAIFELVAAQYHHALFHLWDREAGPSLLKDIKDLGLQDNNTAMGLQWFLGSRRSPYLPAMIEGVLDSFASLLDPALAHPDTIVEVSRNTSYRLRDIDTRFSRSVAEGLEYVRKSRMLTNLEVDLLRRLSELDAHLSRQDVRRKRPATATRVQRLLRDFSCRLVRRSIGVRTMTVRDAAVLREFQVVVENPNGDGMFEVAREIELLLNKNQEFEVSLTTTFGQPLPPSNIQALLVVPRRHVHPANAAVDGRPDPPLQFLEVGEGSSAQNVALTYDLFKALKDIKRGMSNASLPRSILALLDTTGARLAGPIVRDDTVLRRAEIRLGNSVTIEQRRSGFGVVGGSSRR
ncbi:hypothetical protein I7G59_19940 [Sinorhizobium meliloti]|uniref:hypothetical protein n=1 Tax=Rhizobium meliloti TaxID=382 RepID=UPI0023800C30|nr:hypothetical protein [Sinorhizobium meliloti]MDE3799578.1 hypothetical protein [Sinorhizobium meliloti]